MNNQPLNQQERIIYGLILFVISPVIAALASIKNFKFKESKWLLILFFGVFGATMIIQDGKDARVHADYFVESYINKDYKTFKEETINIILLRPQFNGGSTNDDLYLHFLSFLTGKISSNPTLLFFIASFIYGIFYIRGIQKVYELLEGKWSFALIIIFSFFIFWKSLEGINSIRNWTGAWIFFNGAFSFFQTKNKKYLLYILAAPLAHFAYLLIIIPFFVVYIFGNRPITYIVILILSFFFTVENVALIEDYMNLTELGQQKKGYINEEASTYLHESAAEAFHAKYYLVAAKLAISILFYYGVFVFGYLKKDKHSYLAMSLASLGLLMIAFSNLTAFSTTLSNRIFTNGGLFILAYLLIMLSRKIERPLTFGLFSFNSVTYFCMPLIGFFIFTQWSQIGDFMNAKIFASPLIYIIFEGSYSIKEMIRELIL